MAAEMSQSPQTNKAGDTSDTAGTTQNGHRAEDGTKAEPEGGHMALLHKAVSLTKKKCLSAGRYKRFASNFPVVKEKYPKSLMSIHKQFMHQLEASINEEITQLYKEENISGFMNQLDELTEAADSNTTAWRPSGSASANLRAHTQPLKDKQCERLRKLVGTLEQEHAQLRQAVDARRKLFLATQREILYHVSQTELAHSACEELPMDDLENFINS